MNKKLMTMLVACALSVTTLSTTAVFAEDAVVTGETPAVTETTPAPETTPAAYEPEVTLLTPKWTGEEDVVFNVDFKGCIGIGIQEFYVYGDNGEAEQAYFNDERGKIVELDAEGKGTLTLKNNVLKNTKTYGDNPFPTIAIDWSKINKIELMLNVVTNTGIKKKYVYIPVEVKTFTPTPTPAAYEPEITLLTPKWTGDSDIVFEVDAKGGTVDQGEMYVYDANGSNPAMGVEAKIEVNEEGKGKITFTKDALKNAKTWDDNFENQIAIDWTKYSKIEFSFMFELGDQSKDKTVYVESSVKAPEITVTPTTPAQPSTPTKPAENKGTTTSTSTPTTTATKKEAPKTGDTMNVALYASLLLVSALAAVVLATKKKVTE